MATSARLNKILREVDALIISSYELISAEADEIQLRAENTASKKPGLLHRVLSWEPKAKPDVKAESKALDLAVANFKKDAGTSKTYDKVIEALDEYRRTAFRYDIQDYRDKKLSDLRKQKRERWKQEHKSRLREEQQAAIRTSHVNKP